MDNLGWPIVNIGRKTKEKDNQKSLARVELSSQLPLEVVEEGKHNNGGEIGWEEEMATQPNRIEHKQIQT